MEDVVQRMRDDIKMKTEGKESFRVTYDSRDARTAQKTTERLASLFIEENLRDRENVAEDTNQFLDSQLEDAKRRLLEHETKARRVSASVQRRAAVAGCREPAGDSERAGTAPDDQRGDRSGARATIASGAADHRAAGARSRARWLRAPVVTPGR